MSSSEVRPLTVKIERDDEFYFQDVIFLVENHLFKIPARNFIMESEVFGTMFELPQNPNTGVDGFSVDQPLRLEGIKTEHFRQLLRVMYARGFQEEQLTLEQWISVLKLSTQWDMDRIRALAIGKIRATLSPNSPHLYGLLILGQKYRVDQWVIAAVTFLVKRVEPMGLIDVETIGIENVLKIASLREYCTRKLDTKRIEEVFELCVST